MLVTGACSFKKSELANQKAQGHEKLYSEPDAIKVAELPAHKKRVVLVTTNDWLGKFQTQTHYVRDDHQKNKTSIAIGGIGAFSSYLKVIKTTFPKQTLILDSGNFLPIGDYDNKVIKQASKIFAEFSYDAMTLGLQDFNRTPVAGETPESALKTILKDFKTPVLLSNVYDLRSGRVIEWTGTLPYLMKEVNGVKIGLIGLIPDDFLSLTPVQVRNGLYLESMIQSTLRQSRLLRSLGAELIIVMTHAGITCGEEVAEEMKLPLEKVNFETNKSDLCETKGMLAGYLQRLPDGAVDVLLTGRNQNKTANIINGVTVLSSFGQGSSFNLVEIVFNKREKKISWPDSKIHQPVMLCQEFFKESSDCFIKDPSVDHGPRLPAMFWGKPIVKDEKIERKYPLEANRHSIEMHDLLPLGDVIYFANFSGDTPVSIKITGKDLFNYLNLAYTSKSLQEWRNVEGTKKGFLIKGEKFDREKTYTLVTSLENMEKHLYLKKMIAHPSVKIIASDEFFKDEIRTAQAAAATELVTNGETSLTTDTKTPPTESK